MKLIATDMDGTLLRSDKTVSAYTLNALRFACSHGGIFAIATGRMESSVKQYLSYMPFCSYVIATNGSEIYKDGKQIYSKPIPSEITKKIIAFALDNNFHAHLYAENKLYSTKINKRLKDYCRITGLTNSSFDCDVFDFVQRHEVSKMTFLEDSQTCSFARSELSRTLGQEVSIVQSASDFLEFTSAEANKGQALTYLANMLEIKNEDVLVFGDSENDESMLSLAFETYCMENGFERTKRIAKHVCPSNDCDGVAKTLNKIFSEEEK